MLDIRAESMPRVFLIFFPFSLCAATTLFLYNWPAAFFAETSAPSTNVNEALIITTIVGFVTMIVQQFFGTRKATREHEWDIDERKFRAQEAKDDLAKKALDLQIQTASAANLLAQQNAANAIAMRAHLNESGAILDRKTDSHVDALIRKIDENTEAVTNRRITELQEANRKLLQRLEKYESDKK